MNCKSMKSKLLSLFHKNKNYDNFHRALYSTIDYKLLTDEIR